MEIVVYKHSLPKCLFLISKSCSSFKELQAVCTHPNLPSLPALPGRPSRESAAGSALWPTGEEDLNAGPHSPLIAKCKDLVGGFCLAWLSSKRARCHTPQSSWRCNSEVRGQVHIQNLATRVGTESPSDRKPGSGWGPTISGIDTQPVTSC